MFNVLVRNLHLTNFKSVTDDGADLKALTVIVGSNSAGKSTLMQSLLLLSQSLGSDEITNHLSLNGSLVDLGYMGDVKNHSAMPDDSVCISVVLTALQQSDFDFEFVPDEPSAHSQRRIHLEVGFNDSDDSGYPTVTRVALDEVLVNGEGETAVLNSIFENIHSAKNEEPTSFDSRNSVRTNGRITDAREMKSIEVDAVTINGFLPSRLLEKKSMAYFLEKFDSQPSFNDGTVIKTLEINWDATVGRKGFPGDLSRFVDHVFSLISIARMSNELAAATSRTSTNSSEKLSISETVKNLLKKSIDKEIIKRNASAEEPNERWYEKENYLELFLGCELLASIEGETARFTMRGKEESPLGIFRNSARSVKIIFNGKVKYLGPIRQRSIKPPPSLDDRDLGRNGEYAADRFLRLRNRRVNFWDSNSCKVVHIPLEKAVVKVLSDFGLAHGVEAHDGGRSETIFKITPQSGGKSVDLSAVGTGVSQLLPVLMAVLLTRRGEIVVIEQPELHLNPALEKALATFLLDSARCGRQIVVETHSEHLVNRLRRHIAEGTEAEREAIGILFAQQTEGITQYHPAEISEIGGIVNWPPGFLDLGANEAKELLKAAKAKLDKIEAESSPKTSNSEIDEG
jgi:predicted ATPase